MCIQQFISDDLYARTVDTAVEAIFSASCARFLLIIPCYKAWDLVGAYDSDIGNHAIVFCIIYHDQKSFNAVHWDLPLWHEHRWDPSWPMCQSIQRMLTLRGQGIVRFTRCTFRKYTWLMAAGLHELGRIHFRIYPSQLFDQWETGIRSSINLLECGRHAEMMKNMETDRLRYNRSR